MPLFVIDAELIWKYLISKMFIFHKYDRFRHMEWDIVLTIFFYLQINEQKKQYFSRADVQQNDFLFQVVTS